jgi:hypothetical protein
MTLIPNFQEFEETNPLNVKITPALAESLAEYFAAQEGISESSALDSIKNTLSKTFLGSLSYISMIDKVRAEVLKAEKEMLSKRYAYEDEIDSLKTNLKEISKTKDASANIAKAERTISNKTNEYQTYTKMVKARIEKALKTLSDAIKGNKRRMEYWEAGKAEDELVLAEFEYSLAKQRASASPEELKSIEAEIKKAKEEVQKSQQELKDEAEKSKKKEGSENIEGVKTLDKPSSDYRQSLKNKKGRMEAIAEIEHQIIDLKKELKSVRNNFDKKQIERKISSLTGTKKDIENLDKKSSGVKILPTQRDFESINKVARELEKMDLEKDKSHKKVGFDIPTSSAKKAETTSKVNKTINKKEK